MLVQGSSKVKTAAITGVRLFPKHFGVNRAKSCGSFRRRESKTLTDFRLLFSFSKSSETTSKSEDTEVRSGTVVALGMVAAGTSIAARPAQMCSQTQHESNASSANDAA